MKKILGLIMNWRVLAVVAVVLVLVFKSTALKSAVQGAVDKLPTPGAQ